MTNRELQDLLKENFIEADVNSEDGFVRVTTSKAVPEGLQNRIRLHIPAGTKVNFITADRTKVPVPKSLEKWFKATKTS